MGKVGDWLGRVARGVNRPVGWIEVTFLVVK